MDPWSTIHRYHLEICTMCVFHSSDVCILPCGVTAQHKCNDGFIYLTQWNPIKLNIQMHRSPSLLDLIALICSIPSSLSIVVMTLHILSNRDRPQTVPCMLGRCCVPCMYVWAGVSTVYKVGQDPGKPVFTFVSWHRESYERQTNRSNRPILFMEKLSSGKVMSEM